MNTGDRLDVQDAVHAGAVMRPGIAESLSVHGHYEAWCIRDGVEVWRESFDNVVTTLGKNNMLDKFLKGAAYTQTIVMGLKGTGVAVAADTQASHATWSEVGLANAPTYTGNRQAVTMNAASAGSSASPTQAFAITSTGTVAGCFINNGGSATKDDTTGTLFSAGDFTVARGVANGDTINVTYTLSV